MSQPVLRPYQVNGIRETYRAIRAGARRPLVVAPTGAGKTRIATQFIEDATRRGKTVLWLTHTRELVRQAPTVHIETVQTLLSSGRRPHADVVIVDEAHHYLAERWATVVGTYTDAIIIGLTATPERADGTAMGSIFDALISVVSYSDLVREGHLVEPRVIAPIRMGHSLPMSPGAAFLRYSRGQGVIFVGTVAETERYAMEVDGMAVHGGLKSKDRDARVSSFKEGRCKCLVACSTLTEGFDHPPIECIVLATKSAYPGSYLQKVGRCLRAAQGKVSCTIVDLAGNWQAWGWPTEDRSYSLDGDAISVGRDTSKGLWQCAGCGWVARVTPPCCPRCGMSNQTVPQRSVVERQLETKKRTDSVSEKERIMFLKKHMKQCRDKGWKVQRAFVIYKAMFGTWPPRRFICFS